MGGKFYFSSSGTALHEVLNLTEDKNKELTWSMNRQTVGCVEPESTRGVEPYGFDLSTRCMLFDPFLDT